MLLQTTQVKVIIIKLVHLVYDLVLDVAQPFILLAQQLSQLLLTLLLVSVEYLPQFREVLLHFGLNNLPIPLLYPLKIQLRLNKLLLPVEYQGLHLLDLLFDFAHHLRYHVDLTQC